jgi:formylglycine-generating enzyme required for sulfatase activity
MLAFRRLVEQVARRGEISTLRREVLRVKQQDLGLTDEVAETIINSVLEPFRRRLANLEKFRTALREEVDKQYPLASQQETDLRDWQRQVLGLADEDVVEIWQEITAEKAGEYQAKLKQQEAEVLRQRQEAEQLKREQEAEEKLRQQEAERKQQQEAEKIRQEQEAEKKRQQETERLQQETEQKRQQEAAAQKQQAEFANLHLPLQPFEFDVVGLDAKGKEISRNRRQALYFAETLGQGIELEMVAIPGGTFLMGSPKGEGYANEKPQHSVTVQPFLMGKYPVTQAQWRAVAALPKINRDLDPDPSNFKGEQRPVERVSWYDAIEFCKRLSKQTGRNYRLPSEAEWEYACRAGTTTPFHFGLALTCEVCNCKRGETTEVGHFKVANAFGLYDMRGNVREWCDDDWHDNYQGAPNNGGIWLTNDDDIQRLLRGGFWSDSPEGCRSATRFRDVPGLRYDVIGFRVVLRPA